MTFLFKIRRAVERFVVGLIIVLFFPEFTIEEREGGWKTTLHDHDR